MKETFQTLDEALSYWAQKQPEKIFIHSLPKEYSFKSAQTITENLSGFFSRHSVAAGDVVCLLMPRIPELIFSFLAACKIRCIPAPVNYLGSIESIKKTIASVSPAVIIIANDLVSEELKSFLKSLDILIISVPGIQTDSFYPWKDATAEPGKLPLVSPIKSEDLAYYNFTTGSTGLPKAAKCSYGNLFWNTYASAEVFQLNEKDVHLCMFAAFAHPHELFCRALFTGASLVLLIEINPKTIVRVINKYHVTCVMGLAVMYKMIARHCSNEVMPSMRIVESGGMFTSPDIHKQFFEAFKIPILSVWGSTETTGVALANTTTEYRIDGSMGKPCPGYKARIVTDDGTEAKLNEIGELLFSGLGIISDYENAISFPSKNGWYYSGDLAIKDSDGFYYFIERKSGMIKVAGLKVYPLQVELVLQEHPLIEEVAVVGGKDDRRGYVPKAYIVVKDKSVIDIDGIRQFCRDKLAPYMIPKHYILVASLPKIGSGKIDKKALLLFE